MTLHEHFSDEENNQENCSKADDIEASPVNKKNLVKAMCNISRLKQKRSKMLPQALKDLRAEYGSYRGIAKRLGISWGTMQNIYMYRKRTQKVYKRRLTQGMVEAIQKFCLEGPASVTLPDAENCNKVYLNVSLKSACCMFNDSGIINHPISVSTFRKYVPKRLVKLQSKIPLKSCLCEICANFKLLAQALSGAGLKDIIGSCREATSKTLCPYKHLLGDSDELKRTIGEYGFRRCIFRGCQECGVSMLKSKIVASNIDAFQENKTARWHVWENVQKSMKKGNSVKKVNRVERVEKVGSLCELFGLYLDAVHYLAVHIFLAQWQYTQVMNFKSCLEPGVLLCSHDFAKNISCYMNQEIQAAYYSHCQATLAPCVTFRSCDVDGCPEKIRHEVIHLSSNLRHNSSAFKKFHNDTIRIVEASANKEMTFVVNVTDGAPQHYKNRNSFQFTSECSKPMMHIFLGSRHGKFFADQSSGRFLLFLRQAIVSERIHPKCAKDIADFAKREYATADVEDGVCQHYRVSINFVAHIPQSKGTDTVTIEDTRSLHAIKNIGKPGVVMTRTIGCLCPSCTDVSGNDLPCKYPEYYVPWVQECVSSKYASRRENDISFTTNATENDETWVLCEDEVTYDSVLDQSRSTEIWTADVSSVQSSSSGRTRTTRSQSAKIVSQVPEKSFTSGTRTRSQSKVISTQSKLVPENLSASTDRTTRSQSEVARSRVTQSKIASTQSRLVPENLSASTDRTTRSQSEVARSRVTQSKIASTQSRLVPENLSASTDRTTRSQSEVARSRVTQSKIASTQSRLVTENVSASTDNRTTRSQSEAARSQVKQGSEKSSTSGRTTRSQSEAARSQVIQFPEKTSTITRNRSCSQSQSQEYLNYVLSTEPGFDTTDLPAISGRKCLWSDVLRMMKKLSYRDLCHFCADLTLPPLPKQFTGRIIEGIDFADRNALNLYHVCGIPVRYLPLQTVKDGSCLYRALSKCIFNTEVEHGQVRVRVVADAVTNEESYLSNEGLKTGTVTLKTAQKDIDLVHDYCTYSDHFNYELLNGTRIRQIYRAECVDTCKISSYAGIFQMHSAANALQVKLVSFYPDRTIEEIYNNLNRTIFPLKYNGVDDLKTCRILWTPHIREGRLNHFVPLLEREVCGSFYFVKNSLSCNTCQ